jgi:hypothetical protein
MPSDACLGIWATDCGRQADSSIRFLGADLVCLTCGSTALWALKRKDPVYLHCQYTFKSITDNRTNDIYLAYCLQQVLLHHSAYGDCGADHQDWAITELC